MIKIHKELRILSGWGKEECDKIRAFLVAQGILFHEINGMFVVHCDWIDEIKQWLKEETKNVQG